MPDSRLASHPHDTAAVPGVSFSKSTRDRESVRFPGKRMMERLEQRHLRMRRRHPGPGDYDATPAVGAQPVSTKSSGAHVSFSRASRSSADRGFVPKEQQRVLHGSCSPGPVYFARGHTIQHRLRSRSKRRPGRVGRRRRRRRGRGGAHSRDRRSRRLEARQGSPSACRSARRSRCRGQGRTRGSRRRRRLARRSTRAAQRRRWGSARRAGGTGRRCECARVAGARARWRDACARCRRR